MSFNRWSYIFKSTVDMKYQEISGRHLRPPFFFLNKKAVRNLHRWTAWIPKSFPSVLFSTFGFRWGETRSKKPSDDFYSAGRSFFVWNFHGKLNFRKALEVYYGSQLGYDVSLGTPWAESVWKINGSVSTGKSLVVHIHQLEIGWIQRWWDLFSQYMSTFQSSSFPQVPQGCGVEKNLRCSGRTSG